MTADNASVNGKVGRLISRESDVDFEEDQLLGCCAHVINLAAKEGLKLLGAESEELETPVPTSLMDLVDPPDNRSVSLKTIYARIHGLATYVRKTPQRSEAFASIVHLLRTSDGDEGDDEEDPALQDEARQLFDYEEPVNIDEQAPNESQSSKSANRADRLTLDVKTRWNSSYHMLKRVLRLRKACTRYCERREPSKFALSPLEWDYVQQMCDFLHPLSEPTDLLCKRRFPTMQEVIPVYTVIIQGLKKV